MRKEKIAKYIDHTLLKPDATRNKIENLCKEALSYGFYSVCVNPCFVKIAKDFLKSSNVKVCAVVGFPLGANKANIKALEAKECVKDGADEIDMVANISAIKDKNWDYVEKEIKEVRKAIGEKVFLKVIIETCLLNDEEKIKISEIVKKSGANCIKTSTGFSTAGADAQDIALIRSTVGAGFDIKASGGIRNLGVLTKMIEAGATRIGASASCAIIKECEESL